MAHASSQKNPNTPGVIPQTSSDQEKIDSIDLKLAHRAAKSDCTLLITGQTGVGKGRLAKWIHRHSRRRKGMFIPINCGAIPEHIIDSQLFGHVKGAFSGATSDHIGLVRAAENGTLFLDEISELPPSAQTRLLRLLQEREVQPVGQAKPVIVDVRVLAAANTDLHQAVRDKTFREDLLYRLDVIHLEVKPLRDRVDEIASLIAEFNEEFAELYAQPPLTIEENAFALLLAYHWPGNIRQLRTVIERLHVLAPESPVSVRTLVTTGQLRDLTTSPALHSLEEVKREELNRVLAASGGSITKAASKFGVHRSTIYRWLNTEPDLPQ